MPLLGVFVPIVVGLCVWPACASFFVAWLVCPRSRPRAMRPFPRPRRRVSALPCAAAFASIDPAIASAVLHRSQLCSYLRSSQRFSYTLQSHHAPNAALHTRHGPWRDLMSLLSKYKTQMRPRFGTFAKRLKHRRKNQRLPQPQFWAVTPP